MYYAEVSKTIFIWEIFLDSSDSESIFQCLFVFISFIFVRKQYTFF